MKVNAHHRRGRIQPRAWGGGGKWKCWPNLKIACRRENFRRFQKGHASGAHSGFSDGNRWPNFVPMMRMGWRREAAQKFTTFTERVNAPVAPPATSKLL